MNETPSHASSPVSASEGSQLAGGSVDVEQDDEDRRLVHCHLSGDDTGFEQLYRRHRERIFAVLVRMLRNREDALDATQAAETPHEHPLAVILIGAGAFFAGTAGPAGYTITIDTFGNMLVAAGESA